MISFRSVLLLLFLLSLRSAAAEPGTVVLIGESRPTAGRLEEARNRLAEGKSSEAINLLLAVLDSGNNDLVPLKQGRSVSAHWLAHSMLARLSKENLAAYRKRVEAQAQRWLKQAESSGDSSSLHRLALEAFCTPQALKALDQLGDRAFASGRFAEAEQWWRLVTSLEPGRDTDELHYPDPSEAQVIRARAKQLLARLYAHSPTFPQDLEKFAKLHPRAEGVLAGRSGLYHQLLRDLAREQARTSPISKDWLTFGGTPSRAGIASPPSRFLDHVSRLGRSGPAWVFDLTQRARVVDHVPVVEEGSELETARLLAYHPVVVGHLALVADSTTVTAFDLRTGKVNTWYDVTRYVGGIKPRSRKEDLLDLRYSLTVAEDCVYARLGEQAIRDVRPQPLKFGRPDPLAESGESVLVCLSLTPNESGDRRRWLARAMNPPKEFAVFEGAPVVSHGRVFIAATRFEGDRVVTAIHCYPAHPEDAFAPLLWKTDVCETRELQPATGGEEAQQRRTRHHLLTLAGSRLIWCSHSGAIVALDARTGRRAWAFRYPRREVREPEDDPILRELAPPVYADGKLFVAPLDSDWLYCLDPLTGAIIWQRDRLDVVHLVGVGQGRLIFTTWKNPGLGRLHAGGLRAILADDGSDRGGWALPDDGGGLIPMGRPLLVGDLVLWPTVRQPYGVFAVRQVDGRQPDNPSLLHRIPSGNLIFANNCLLVADAKVLYAFVPGDLLPEEEEMPEKVGWRSSLRRAFALAHRGQSERAWNYLRDQQRALTSDGHSSRMRQHEFRLGQQEIFRQALPHLLKANPSDGARSWSHKARANASPHEELAVLVEMAQTCQHLGEKATAQAAWAEIARTPRLGQLLVEDAQGLPQRASWVAQQHLSAQIPFPRMSIKPASTEAEEPVPSTLALRLEPFERLLFVPDGQSVWTAKLTEMICRDRRSGKVRWRVRLAFTPLWARPWNDRLLCAGEEGVACLHNSDGRILWRFPAPRSNRVPTTRDERIRVVSDPSDAEPLSGFHLLGEMLVFQQGPRQLLGLEVRQGVIRWRHFAPGAAFAMPPPRGCIQRVFPVAPDRLLIQASAQRWLVQASTGEILHRQACSLTGWPREPVSAAEGRIILISDPQRVELFDVRHQQSLWTYSLSGETTRSGEPPLTLATGNAILVIEPWNIGYRLQKLDRDTGKPVWARTPLLTLDKLQPEEWLLTQDTLYHAGAGQLFAWSLQDGKERWRQPLPGKGGWRLQQQGKTLLAWRDRAASVRFRFRGPLGSLQWHLGPLPAEEAWSVLVLQSEQGKLLQRLSLEPESLSRPRPTPWRSPLSLWPAVTVDRDEQGSPGPAVVRDSHGLVAALGNHLRIVNQPQWPSSK